jgi:hypothetical protein
MTRVSTTADGLATLTAPFTAPPDFSLTISVPLARGPYAQTFCPLVCMTTEGGATKKDQNEEAATAYRRMWASLSGTEVPVPSFMSQYEYECY